MKALRGETESVSPPNEVLGVKREVYLLYVHVRQPIPRPERVGSQNHIRHQEQDCRLPRTVAHWCTQLMATSATNRTFQDHQSLGAISHPTARD